MASGQKYHAHLEGLGLGGSGVYVWLSSCRSQGVYVFGQEIDNLVIIYNHIANNLLSRLLSTPGGKGPCGCSYYVNLALSAVPSMD